MSQKKPDTAKTKNTLNKFIFTNLKTSSLIIPNLFQRVFLVLTAKEMSLVQPFLCVKIKRNTPPKRKIYLKTSKKWLSGETKNIDYVFFLAHMSLLKFSEVWHFVNFWFETNKTERIFYWHMHRNIVRILQRRHHLKYFLLLLIKLKLWF